MITGLDIQYSKSDHDRKVEISLPILMNDEFALLSILNRSGEQILKMKLTGTKHEIDLSFLKNDEMDLKIETSNSVIMKRIK